MKAFALHPTPSWRDVFAAELRAVGLAFRPVASVVAAAAVVLFLLLTEELRSGGDVDLSPELALFVSLLAPLLPIAVWKGEYRFRRSYLAAMPVEWTRHVLVKIVAGWCWLMIATAGYAFLLALMTYVTDGRFGDVYMRVLAAEVPKGASAEEIVSMARPWVTPCWEWLVLLSGPTVGYLLGSTIVLAGSLVRRWLAGLALVVIFFMFVDEEIMDLGRWAGRVEQLLVAAIESPYGLRFLFLPSDTEVGVQLSSGAEAGVWESRPTLTRWLLTNALWWAFSVAALAAVLRGHRRS